MKKDNRNAGFTLVELSVYLLISSILLIMVAQLLGSMNGLFVNTRTRSEAKQLGDTVYTYIAEEIRYATHLGIHDPTVNDPNGNVRLKVEDGKLLRNESNYYGDEFYLGRQIEIETEKIDEWTVKLTVRVQDKAGKELYETASTIECVNIEIQKIGFEYSAIQNVNPVISYTRGIIL